MSVSVALQRDTEEAYSPYFGTESRRQRVSAYSAYRDLEPPGRSPWKMVRCYVRLARAVDQLPELFQRDGAAHALAIRQKQRRRAGYTLAPPERDDFLDRRLACACGLRRITSQHHVVPGFGPVFRAPYGLGFFERVRAQYRVEKDINRHVLQFGEVRFDLLAVWTIGVGEI